MCMSFYLEHRTFRSGNLFNLKACARMSALKEQPMEVSETHTTKQCDEGNTEFSPNSIEEKRKANLETLHAQITLLMQSMNKLIQENSARINSTAGFRNHRFQSEFPFHLHTGPELPEPCH